MSAGGAFPGASATPAAQITAASFPSFVPPATSTTNSAGTSLLDLFPNVEASVLLDIARHEFKPMDLSKLDSRYRDKAPRAFDFDGTGAFVVREASVKDYPNFHALYSPLSTYFDILAAFVASGNDAATLLHVVRASSAYLRRLEEYNEKYHWPAVLAYHMDFHFRRRREMTRGIFSGWDSVDDTLKSDHLHGQERPRVMRGAQPAKSSSASSSAGQSPEVCRLFNKGSCASPCRYKRVHKCTSCNSTDHGQSACTKTGAAPGAAT
ncbi:uncharacterized protein BXZ73DRAFT_90948 [Epithele typhae]|uniref:uncharacterized protein n=1 Tax=Epithele typhae TaxID=378194 RepID=UPI002008993C|nr:uncharacterized protein BXZ73DRAFT_90948 [Epithele typhae]KAH9926274.1 hypothetical protein BXZ73DRAFT_90948 [Epithele typhae]